MNTRKTVILHDSNNRATRRGMAKQAIRNYRQWLRNYSPRQINWYKWCAIELLVILFIVLPLGIV